MKKVYISFGVMVVCIIAAVFLNKAAKNTELDYQEVKARVVSSESRQNRIRVNGRTTTQTVYDVVVSYGGKEYDLKNAHNTYMYRKGSDATVYFSNGKMYADLAGVRNSTPAGIAYFVALIGAFATFIMGICWWSKEGTKKKDSGPLQKI